LAARRHQRDSSNLTNLAEGIGKSAQVLRAYMGKLEDELSAVAAVSDGSQEAKLFAIRAQIQPLREALDYLAEGRASKGT
jgi:hypothetical protein